MPEHYSSPEKPRKSATELISGSDSKPFSGLKAAKPEGKLPQDFKVMINGKSTVLYMGPEDGPFECQHCKYFSAPSSCRLVAGQIAPQGCCSLYEPKQEGSGMSAVRGTAYDGREIPSADGQEGY